MLLKMHRPPTKDSFCDKHGKAWKLVITDYSWHMGYIDRGQNG